jgi:hypothetical protein
MQIIYKLAFFMYFHVSFAGGYCRKASKIAQCTSTEKIPDGLGLAGGNRIMTTSFFRASEITS